MQYLYETIFISTIITFIVRYLLAHPLTLQKKRRKLSSKLANVNLIAHRGSRLEGLPENSIAAFKHACKNHAEVIELDVRLSNDGHVVVFHDDTFTRMSNGNCCLKVSEVNYKDFPTIVPCKEQLVRCQEFSSDDCFRIPKFFEVLEVIPPDVAIIVEVKVDSVELINKVHQIIQDFDKERFTNMFWFSLQESINEKLKSKDPHIATIVSVQTMLKTLLFYHLGILPFFTFKDDIFGVVMEEITIDTVRKEKAVAFLPESIKQLLAYLLAGKPPALMMTPTLFEYFRNLRIPTWFLGVNSEVELEIALHCGATAVLTDQVSWLKNMMDKSAKKFVRIEE